MKIADGNVLITGGAGFIGSHLADAYLAAGANSVTIFDRNPAQWPANIAHLKKDKRVTRFVGDITHQSHVMGAIRYNRCNIVEHQAADLEVAKGMANAYTEMDNNIRGTLAVLQAAKAEGVELFQYASSGAVYGRSQGTHKETDAPEPHWPYGVSKLAGEQYCMQFHRLYGMNVNAFRYGIVYGPREWYGRVLTMFLKRIVLEGKPPIIYGDGKQTRDFVYVKDICQAHLKAVQQGIAGQILNLGSGGGITPRQLASWVCEVTGNRRRRSEVVFVEVPEGQAPKEQPDRIRLQGEIDMFELDSNHARSQIHWEATTEFCDGLRAETAWLRKNPHAWDYPPKV